MNTLRKISYKAMVLEDYAEELLPQQIGVGVKFAAKLLAMDIRINLHVKPDHILIGIDLKNAYNAISKAARNERHRGHTD